MIRADQLRAAHITPSPRTERLSARHTRQAREEDAPFFTWKRRADLLEHGDEILGRKTFKI
jgi:hypothetical protein